MFPDLTEAEPVKDSIFEAFARIGQGFAHPLRIRVLELLAQGERTVDEVCENTPLRRKNASAQLRVLFDEGLVARRKEGVHVFYRLADDRVIAALRKLQELAVAVLPEARELDREYYRHEDVGDPLTLDELRDRLAHGTSWLLDVRPLEEFRQGHLPGAHSIPVFELGHRLNEVPTDREILLYCRGPYCVWEVEATRFLRAKGRQVRRLGATLVDWRLSGGAASSAEAEATTSSGEQIR